MTTRGKAPSAFANGVDAVLAKTMLGDSLESNELAVKVWKPEFEYLKHI